MRGSFEVGMLALLCAAMCGCGDAEVNQFTEGVSDAKGVHLLEGLPHQYWEAEVFKKELRTRELAHINGYPFYQQPLSVEEADAEQLKSMLGDAGRYKRWEGEKKCGGYHPDYAVVFEGEHLPSYAMLCFGCEEVRLASTWVDVRRDMSVIDDVEELLQKYRKQRPERLPFGQAAVSASASAAVSAAPKPTAGPSTTASSSATAAASGLSPSLAPRGTPPPSPPLDHGF